MAMRGRDEYEDLDEYEDEYEDEEDQEDAEEEYEDEVHQPTEQELEYLELRQKLKESIRKQMKKDPSSSIANSREKKSSLPYSNFGSFFGPSQPVIAQRVIEESKSLLENPQLAESISKPKLSNHKVHASASSGSSSRLNGHPTKTNKVMQTQTKVQMLKNTRDYSFLLSDDAEIPAPKKEPHSRNVSLSRPEGRSAQLPLKSKEFSSNNGKKVLNSGEGSRAVPSDKQMKPRGPHSSSSAGKPTTSMDYRKQNGSNNGMDYRKQNGSNNGMDYRKQNGSNNGMDYRKQNGSNNGIGPGRPQLSRPQMPKSLPPKTYNNSSERKSAPPSAKNASPVMHKPNVSRSQQSAQKQTLDRRRELQESLKGKPTSRQPVSRPQIKQPPAKGPSRVTSQQENRKKRPARKHPDEDAEDVEAISMIRKMFGYNPRKYADVDDDSDMEANFDDILKEERRSAKIAAREDEEELRKLEEEERRQRMRKEAKKRKLS
ncbi:uncharacterized protein LOC108196660 isoform X1 [Daucus carota subsp. sativus]|uniref:uncharacterized protein LOC108196660 isoform X1 n=1 Tax=Daucus carota subsp. sativus TaxID=79200 RepID=UPI0007EF2372|nr:PREDICTED: protein SPT2 homolog isoform X2 [Daucus carota subsp. sativus]